MGLDLDKTLTQIQGADEATLNRIAGFVNSGDQSEENIQARNAITAKLQGLKAQQQAQAMAKEAADYRANLPGQTQNSFSRVSDETRRGLAENLSGLNSGYNQKGLLYSGLRQGAQAQARGQAASDLAGAKNQINEGAETQAHAMEQAAQNATAGGQRTQITADQDAYAKAMQNVQQRRQTVQTIGKAAGSLVGPLAGKAIESFSGGSQAQSQQQQGR